VNSQDNLSSKDGFNSGGFEIGLTHINIPIIPINCKVLSLDCNVSPTQIPRWFATKTKQNKNKARKEEKKKKSKRHKTKRMADDNFVYQKWSSTRKQITLSKVGLIRPSNLAVKCIAPMVDGTVLTFDRRGVLKHWSATFELLKVGDELVDCVLKVIDLKDGKFLCGGYQDLEIRSLETGGLLRSLYSQQYGLGDFVLLESFKKSAVAVVTKMPEIIKLLKITEPTSETILTIPVQERCGQICELGNDKRLAGAFVSEVKIWSLVTGECLQTLQGFRHCWDMTELDNGKIALCGDGSIQISNTQQPQHFYEIQCGARSFIKSKAQKNTLIYSDGGSWVKWCDYDGNQLFQVSCFWPDKIAESDTGLIFVGGRTGIIEVFKPPDRYYSILQPSRGVFISITTLTRGNLHLVGS